MAPYNLNPKKQTKSGMVHPTVLHIPTRINLESTVDLQPSDIVIKHYSCINNAIPMYARVLKYHKHFQQRFILNPMLPVGLHACIDVLKLISI